MLQHKSIKIKAGTKAKRRCLYDVQIKADTWERNRCLGGHSEHCVRVQRLKPVPRSHRSAVYELAATRRSNRRGRTESRTDAGRAAGSLANAMAALMMCGSPTDKTAHKADAAMCLEASGDASLAEVAQLVLRGKALSGIGCAPRLTHLTVLSLSHNRLTSIESLTPLAALEVLNVNFNQLPSLELLAKCTKLQKIYASNNIIRHVDGCASLKELRTLCLFANHIEHCELTLDALSRCSSLKELDLDGNPLAREEGYRHHALNRMPRLEALDGDTIQTLDRDLARDYVKGKGGATARVDTAFDWSSLPRESRLFGEAADALNDDKVAVDYLAKQILANPMRGPVDDDAWRPDDARKFVARLKREATAHRQPQSAALDVADPYVTIRKLIQLVESLQAELRGTKQGPDAELEKEVDALRVENGNMYQLQQENGELRKRAYDFETLTRENKDLNARLGEAEAQLQAHHLAEITGSTATRRPRTAAEVMEDCSGEMDSELEDLFRRNASGLAQIKQDLAVMQGAPNPSLIDEAPLTSPRPHDRDPDVDTPAVKRVVRSNVPRPGTAGGRRLKCGAAEISKRRPKTPSVADILRGVREGDAESEKWSDAMTARSTATVSPDRVVATKHAWLLGDGVAPSNDGYGDGFGESKMTEL